MPLTLSGWFRKRCSNVSNQFIYFLVGWLLCGCKTDYQNLSTYSENKQLQVVVQTPAGSNHPQVYDSKQKTFIAQEDAGKPAQIKFLPFPGNYGFIPSTYFRAGDATETKPLEALVLAESTARGTVQEVVPIATLVLEEARELKYIILAVPARPSEQLISATDLESFTQEYPAAKSIIQQWFLHHNPEKAVRFISWKDERFSEQLIQKSLK